MDFDSYDPTLYPCRYFYRGHVIVSTFGMDPNKSAPFSDTVVFDHPDLYKARCEAIRWWRDTSRGLDREGKYFLPYAGSDEFELGKNAAALIIVSLVEVSGDEEFEFDLIGGDDKETNEALEMEAWLFGWDEDDEDPG